MILLPRTATTPGIFARVFMLKVEKRSQPELSRASNPRCEIFNHGAGGRRDCRDIKAEAFISGVILTSISPGRLAANKLPEKYSSSNKTD